MARKKKTGRKNPTLTLNRGIAALDRAEALARGGQQALIWRSGGTKGGKTVDRKKRRDKRACRGRFHE